MNSNNWSNTKKIMEENPKREENINSNKINKFLYIKSIPIATSNLKLLSNAKPLLWDFSQN